MQSIQHMQMCDLEMIKEMRGNIQKNTIVNSCPHWLEMLFAEQTASKRWDMQYLQYSLITGHE